MPIITTWSLLIPAAFLVAIAALYLLIKKKKFPAKLKTFIPFAIFLFVISSLLTFLHSKFGPPLSSSKTMVDILEFAFFFFLMILSVKIISFLVFDLILGTIHNIRYSRLLKIKDVLIIILYGIGILLFTKYYLNKDLTVFIASSAILSVVVGFALQDILGDLFSGIALNLEESLLIGDWIKTGNIEGKIEQFRWRSIKIRTTDNTLVVIPNRIASKQEVQRLGNVAEPFALRLRIGVSYKNTPDSVIAAILKVTNSVPSVLKTPEPVVMVSEFGDFAISYELKFWMSDYSIKDPVKSEIRRKAWYAFNRNNIQIPFPIRDIYIKKEKEERPWAESIIAILRANELFDAISDEQLAKLAVDIEVKFYGDGETLIHEGEVGRYFFYIIDGEVEVLKDSKVLARLKTGNYIGEMALFTGEMTVADVRVSRESQILRISSEKFRETVKINEEMARKLSEVIARRRGELMEFAKKEEHLRSTAVRQESETIFLRIKKYFSL
jgi:small-conductance mechanosensitive channel